MFLFYALPKKHVRTCPKKSVARRPITHKVLIGNLPTDADDNSDGPTTTVERVRKYKSRYLTVNQVAEKHASQNKEKNKCSRCS